MRILDELIIFWHWKLFSKDCIPQVYKPTRESQDTYVEEAGRKEKSISHLWTSTKFRSLPSADDSILRWKAFRSRKLRRKKMKGPNNRSWPCCETTIPNQIYILSQGFAGQTPLLLSSISGRYKIHFEQCFMVKTFINYLSQLTILLCIF